MSTVLRHALAGWVLGFSAVLATAAWAQDGQDSGGTIGGGALPEMPAQKKDPSDLLLEGIKLDFAIDGVRGTRDEVKAKYQAACEGGLEAACNWPSWFGESESKLSALGQSFRPACSVSGRVKKPVVCTIAGWEMLQRSKSAPDDKDLRRDALKMLKTACELRDQEACRALAPTQVARTEVLLYERGCRAEHLASCVSQGVALQRVSKGSNERAESLFLQACEGGDLPGCYELGVAQQESWTRPNARQWFGELCDLGHRMSCSRLGAELAVEGETQDLSEALKRFQRGCELGDATSCHRGGTLLEKGGSGAPDVEAASRLYSAGCDRNHGPSCERYGMLIVENKVKGSLAAAIPSLEEACRQDLAGGCAVIGTLYLRGEHVERDVVRARRAFERSCPKNIEGVVLDDSALIACAGLASIYEQGIGGAARDRTEAAIYYGTACDAGNMESCNRRGELIMALREEVRDEQEALTSFGKACDGGIESACQQVASILVTSVQVRDLERASEVYQQMCDKGDTQSCVEVGILAEKGTTGQPDYVQARSLYQRAANEGSPEAQRRLAHLMWHGLGGKKKRKWARNYFKKACAAGDQDACMGPR